MSNEQSMGLSAKSEKLSEQDEKKVDQTVVFPSSASSSSSVELGRTGEQSMGVGVTSEKLPEQDAKTSVPGSGGFAPPPPDAWHMDEPIFTQEDTAVVYPAILPVVASQQDTATSSAATIDLSFEDAFPGDHAGWLHRAFETSHESRAHSSRDARCSRSRRPSSRSRSPRDRDRTRRDAHVPLYLGTLRFLSGMTFGEACREVLCGPRQDGLALFNLQSGTVSFQDVELACRRRALREIRRGMCYYFGIAEHPARRWREHQADNHIWQETIVLTQAESSFDTSALERALIREYGLSVRCLNSGPGGEHASSGSPHFCYMLVAEQGPLRRPPRRPRSP